MDECKPLAQGAAVDEEGLVAVPDTNAEEEPEEIPTEVDGEPVDEEEPVAEEEPEAERHAFACVERHQAFALTPVSCDPRAAARGPGRASHRLSSRLPLL